MESNRRNWLVPPDINALRAVSDRPMKTRWEPVDLACGHLREEVTVRTKLARSDESMAVCIAEAVSHALLLANGFRMAEPFCVVIGEQFAQDLTTQYRFAEPVRPGRHWGTRLMRRGVQEVELTASLVEVLADPPVLLRLFLADVILGNPDRKTHGNVLLADTPERGSDFDLIPIDQSEAFFHPSALLDPRTLCDRCDQMGAEIPEGMEGVVLDGGTMLVERCFARAKALHADVRRYVTACHDEWFDGAGVDPSLLKRFLEHRVGELETLARKEYWLGVASIDTGGQHVLDLR